MKDYKAEIEEEWLESNEYFDWLQSGKSNSRAYRQMFYKNKLIEARQEIDKNEYIRKEQIKKLKQEVSTALFKLYCPLIAAGVDKELLKKEIREIYELYGIEEKI